MYFFQITKWISLKLKNIILSNFKMYLSEVGCCPGTEVVVDQLVEASLRIAGTGFQPTYFQEKNVFPTNIFSRIKWVSTQNIFKKTGFQQTYFQEKRVSNQHIFKKKRVFTNIFSRKKEFPNNIFQEKNYFPTNICSRKKRVSNQHIFF